MKAVVGFWAVYTAIILAVTLAAALVARSKRRDPLTFALLGLLLGWIGILIAALLPAIKLENLYCSYLDTGGAKARTIKGRLLSYGDRLVFMPTGRGEPFSILFSTIIGSRVITKRQRRKEGLPGKMFGIANLRVLELVFITEGQQGKACFSVYKTAAEPLQQRIAQMPPPFPEEPEEAQISSGGSPPGTLVYLNKPSLTGTYVLMLIVVLLIAGTPFIMYSLTPTNPPETSKSARTGAQPDEPPADELNPASVTAVLNPVQVIVPGEDSSPIDWTCYDIAPLNEDTTWACGTNGVVARIEGESRWVARLAGDFSDFIEICAPDEANIWVLDAEGRIAFSNDSGKTFGELKFQNQNVGSWAFQDIRAIDPACVWLLSDGDHVLRTLDAGANWECHELLDMQGGVSDTGPIECFMPVDRLTCWAAKRLWQLSDKRAIDVDRDCFVYKTTDGGQSWQLTSSRGFPNVGLIEARGPREAFILVGEEGQGMNPDVNSVHNMLLVTSDGGKTWSEPLLSDVSSVDLSDDDTLWAVLPGEPQSQVLVGTNAGSAWVSHPVDIPLTRLTLDNRMWIGPGAIGLSETSAWVLGSGSFWWGLARTTDSGQSWTYYDRQEP